MKRVNKKTSVNSVSVILRSNEGTSLVLVSIIAIIIITGVIILRISTSSLWASADKQVSQDQAYEMATSLGASMNELIVSDAPIDLDSFSGYTETNVGLPNSKIEVWVVPPAAESENNYYTLYIRAKVGDSVYIYTAMYKTTGSAPNLSYSRLY